MSTGVHRLLDGTVPFLRSLVTHKILSRTEARIITTRRDVYERRVAHPASSPSDWDAYIAYEEALLALLHRRIASSLLTLTAGTVLVDRATRRVTFLHTRATRANPGHVDGWLAAVAAALAAAPLVRGEGRGGRGRGRHAGRTAPARRRIGAAARVLARALALLPREERLWVAAVRLHAVAGDDIRGGRAVALAGLQQVRRSAALWAAYWALEVAYVSRLREQRRLLGKALPSGEQSERGDHRSKDSPGKTDAPGEETPTPTAPTVADGGTPAASPAGATGGDVGGGAAAAASVADSVATGDRRPSDDADAAPPLKDGAPPVSSAGVAAAASATASRPLTFWEGGILVTVWSHATAALAGAPGAEPPYWARLYRLAATTRGAPPPALAVLASRLLAAHPADVDTADAVARGGLTAAELAASPPSPRPAQGGRLAHAGNDTENASTDGPQAVVDRAGGVPPDVATAIADGLSAYMRVSPPAVEAATAALAFAADVRSRYAAATPSLVPPDAALVEAYAAAAPGVDLSSLAAAAAATGIPSTASASPTAPLLAAITAARDLGGASPPGGWEPLVDATIDIAAATATATGTPTASATSPAADVVAALRTTLQAAVGCAAASPAARDAAAAAGVRLEAAVGGGLPAVRAVVDAASAVLPGGAAIGAATAVAALAAEAAAADAPADTVADPAAAVTVIADRRRRVRSLYAAWVAAVPPASEKAEEAWLEALRWERRPGAGGGGGEPRRVAALLWRARKSLGPLRAATFDQLVALMDVQ
ncbi:hypothetical protein MMPV_005951 [Pyropia vietnamensis]